MPDYTTLYAQLATLAVFCLFYLWRLACIDRDEARAELEVVQTAKDGLALDLAAVKAARDAAVREGQRVAGENVDLQRENGRFAAEIRQLKQEAERRKQPRDPKTGRMLPKPGAKRPRKPVAAQSGSATTN